MDSETTPEEPIATGEGGLPPVLNDRYRLMITLLLLRDGQKSESDLLLRGEPESREVEDDLVENHLPKLEEAGYIEWDRESGTISKGPRFDEIEPILELMGDDQPLADWP